jgi:hypothetical protein
MGVSEQGKRSNIRATHRRVKVRGDGQAGTGQQRPP